MSNNIHFVAEREVIVKRTGETAVQKQDIDVWQTPTSVTFKIKNRWNDDVRFECDLPAEVAGKSYGEQLGYAVQQAYKSGTNLSGTDLSGAYLVGAYLIGVDLSDADLSDADLYQANLYRANLSRANLSRANLSRADLVDANLSVADLSRANLVDADLVDADLYRADLSDATRILPDGDH